MRLLGVHHLGLSVDDVERAVQDLGDHGFEGGPPFELAGVDAARGNGLVSARMHVAFVADGTSTVELIQHLDGGAGPGPGEGDSGFQRWRILSKRVERPPGSPGVSFLPVPDEGGVHVTVTARDIQATRALLETIGVRERAAGVLTAPGVTVTLERAMTERQPPFPTALGRSHLALRVDDAHAAHDRLLAGGFDCVSEPIPHGEAVWWFFVRDPGGSGEIEIVQDGT